MSVRSDPVDRTGTSAASKDLRLLVGFSEGSASNIVASMIAPTLSAFLSQTVRVERLPGENGALCAEHVACAAPDGRTLAIAIQTHLIGSLLQTRKRYDPIADFAPVAMLARWPMILAVSNALGVTSVDELIALAKSRPGELVYGASAIGGSPHLAAILFRAMTGLDMRLRVYTETNTLYADLAQGRLAVTFNNSMSVLPLARAGKLRMLATTGAVRSPAAPELPTMAETVPGYEVVSWIGVLAPAATPSPIVARINEATARTVQATQVRELFRAHGMEPVVASPADFARHLRVELDRWGRFIETNRAAFPKLQ